MVKTKILAMILAVAMVVAVVPAFTLTASAEEAPVPAEPAPELAYTATVGNITAGQNQVCKLFPAQSGDSVKIEFDLIYNTLPKDSKNQGDQFVGISKSNPKGNGEYENMGFGSAAVAIQGMADGYVAFHDGTELKKDNGFIPEAEVPYHVTLDINVTAHTYTATVKGGEGEKLVDKTVGTKENPLGFRNKNLSEVDVLINTYNGGDGKTTQTVKNFKVYKSVPTQTAEVTVNYVDFINEEKVLGTETVNAVVGKPYEVKGNIDNKFVFVKGKDKTYVAELKESTKIESVAAESEAPQVVTAKVIPAYSLKGANLFTNGTLEDEGDIATYEHLKQVGSDPTKYEIETAQPGVAASDLRAHNGSKSLTLLGPGGSASDFNFIKRVPLTAPEGKKYVLSMWRHGNSASSLTLTAGLLSAEPADSNNPQNVDESCGGVGNDGNSTVSANVGNLPNDEWHQMGWVLTGKENSKEVEIFARWAEDQYFDDFELYELATETENLPVKLQYVDENGQILHEETIADTAYTGYPYTPTQPYSKYFTSEETGYLYTINDVEQVTLGQNGEAPIGLTKVAKLAKQENGSYNMIENGDFSNGKEGWTFSEEFTVTENNELSLKDTSAWSDENGSSRRTSGLGGTNSLQKTVPVTKDKTYFYSMDILTPSNAAPFLNFSFANTDLVVSGTNNDDQAIVGTPYVEDGCQSDFKLADEGNAEVNGSSKMASAYTGNWHTFQGVSKAPDGARVFEFDAYYLRDAAGTLVDNFKVYELAEVAEIPDSEMTVIAGNDPVLPNYVDATFSDGTTDKIAVAWDKQANEADFDAVTTDPVVVTGTPVDTHIANKTAKLSVNVVADDYAGEKEMPQSAWGEIKSVDAENAATSAHRFYTPVKGTVDFEFDVTFKDLSGLVKNAGNFGIFLGDSSVADKNLPSYGRDGNAIGIQGCKDGNNEFGFKNGSADITPDFKVETNKPYRVFITAYTDDVLGVAEEEGTDAPVLHNADTYDATVYDADGVVFSKTGLAFRKAVDKIDTLIVATNTSGKDGDIVVSNFRVSWLDGFKTYYVNAECDNACGVEPWNLIDPEQLPDDNRITAKVIDSDAEVIAPLPAKDHTYIGREVRAWDTYAGQDPEATTAQENGAEFLVMIYSHNFPTTNMFNYDLVSKSGDTLAEVTASTNGANGFNLAPLDFSSKQSILVMQIDAESIKQNIFDKTEGKKLGKAEFHFDAAQLNNAGDNKSNTFTAYYIPTSTVADFGTKTLTSVDGDTVLTAKNWVEATGAIEVGSTVVNLKNVNKHNVEITVPVDLSAAEITSGEDFVIALTVTGKNELFVAGMDAGQYDASNKRPNKDGENTIALNAPFLSKLETVSAITPEALTAVLGWHGGKFTIDYKKAVDDENTVSVAVQPEDGDAAISAEFNDADALAFSAANTNRIYTAYSVSADGTQGEPVQTSIYALVVKAVADLAADGGKIAEEQIGAINTVLNNGGLFITPEGKLTAEAEMIMSIENNVVTLKPEVVAAGLKFSDGIKTGDTLYNKATVNEDGTVTLSNEEGASVDGVMLEEIEFVFEPDEVTDSADYSGEIDFVEVI